MALSEPGRTRMVVLVLLFGPLISFGIIARVDSWWRWHSFKDTSITVSLSPALVEDGVTLKWEGARDVDGHRVETIPLHPGRQAIHGDYFGSGIQLYCHAGSGLQEFTLAWHALRYERLDSQVTCAGTVDQFDCVLEAGGEIEKTSGSCYPPDGPAVVEVEPIVHDIDGSARLQVVADPSHPLKGQLELAAVDYWMRIRRVSWVDVSASERALTAIHVGRAKLLVSLRAGTVLRLRNDGCAPWELDSNWLHAEGAGQFRVRAATGTPFTIERENGPATREVVPALGLTRYYPASYRPCGGDRVATALDRILLAIGAGERWTINLRADGRILAGVREPDSDRDEFPLRPNPFAANERRSARGALAQVLSRGSVTAGQ